MGVVRARECCALVDWWGWWKDVDRAALRVRCEIFVKLDCPCCVGWIGLTEACIAAPGVTSDRHWGFDGCLIEHHRGEALVEYYVVIFGDAVEIDQGLDGKVGS